MKDRLMKVITSEGLTPSLLADEIGVQRSGISHILSGRNNPSLDFLQKLLTRFPKLNANWLVMGQGSMYVSGNTNIPDLFSQSQVSQKSQVSPTLTATPEKTSSGESDKINHPDTQPVLPPPIVYTQKNIERIVTFYTDKTFASYSPE